jgi:hypothetical protein
MALQDLTVEEVDLPRLYRTSQARMDSKRDVTLEAWEANRKVSQQEAKAKL